MGSKQKSPGGKGKYPAQKEAVGGKKKGNGVAGKSAAKNKKDRR